VGEGGLHFKSYLVLFLFTIGFYAFPPPMNGERDVDEVFPCAPGGLCGESADERTQGSRFWFEVSPYFLHGCSNTGVTVVSSAVYILTFSVFSFLQTLSRLDFPKD